MEAVFLWALNKHLKYVQQVYHVYKTNMIISIQSEKKYKILYKKKPDDFRFENDLMCVKRT